MHPAFDAKLAESKFTISPDGRPEQAPAGWLVLNAPRPLYGSERDGREVAWEGEFAHGRFYVAVNPGDPRADTLIQLNLELDAWPVVYLDSVDTRALLTDLYSARSPHILDRIAEQIAELSVIEMPRHIAGLAQTMRYGPFVAAVRRHARRWYETRFQVTVLSEEPLAPDPVLTGLRDAVGGLFDGPAAVHMQGTETLDVPAMAKRLVQLGAGFIPPDDGPELRPRFFASETP